MVINHILHYGHVKAHTKRLWVTELFLTRVLCPLPNIFSPLKIGWFAYTLKKTLKKKKSCLWPEINHKKIQPLQRMFWKHMKL